MQARAVAPAQPWRSDAPWLESASPTSSGGTGRWSALIDPRFGARLWNPNSHGAAAGHSARRPVRRVRAGPSLRRALQGWRPRPPAGAAATGAGCPAGRARRARHARGAAPAAVARRHIRRLRQRAEPRHQPPADGAGRRRGQPTLHRDPGAPRLPLHCAGRCRRPAGAGRTGGGARDHPTEAAGPPPDGRGSWAQRRPWRWPGC